MNYYDLYSYNRINRVLEDDIPSIVRESSSGKWQTDDVTFSSRPNTDYVINRDYRRHAPVWNWAGQADLTVPVSHMEREPTRLDYSMPTFARAERELPKPDYTVPTYVRNQHLSFGEPEPRSYMRSSVTPSKRVSSRPYLYTESDPSVLNGGRYAGRQSVLIPEPKREKPYYLQSIIPPRYTFGDSRKSINPEFPFKKYRSDFIPFAPYPRLYDSVKYCPNPEWSGHYGYRYRKARFIYDPQEHETSRSREIERAMREARLRELCKGVYSSNYGQNIASKVAMASDMERSNKVDSSPAATPALNSKLVARTRDPEIQNLIQNSKSLEAETIVSEGEKQRKHLSLAEKRRRNETLAVGLTNESLVKSPPTSSIEKSETDSKPATAARATEIAVESTPAPCNESQNDVVVEAPQQQEVKEPTPEIQVPQEAKEEDFRKIDIKIEAKEPEVEPAAEDVTETVPTSEDSEEVVEVPIVQEEVQPAKEPTPEPTKEPTPEPTKEPTPEPVQPSLEPTEVPQPADETPIVAAETTEDDTGVENAKAASEPAEEVPETVCESEAQQETETTEPQEIEINTKPEEEIIETESEENNVTIKIITETLNADELPTNVEEATTETTTTVNEDGSETIETVITEYTKTSMVDDDGKVETTITTVTIESKNGGDDAEITTTTTEQTENGSVVEASMLDYDDDEEEGEVAEEAEADEE